MISYVSGASAASNTVSMPSHQAGDMILVYAFRSNSTTPPSIPAGYILSYNPTGANTCAMTVGYKIATSGSEATGTWTNATSTIVVVYRKSSAQTWTDPIVYVKMNTGTSIDYAVNGGSFFGPRYSINQDNTEIWNVRFAGHRTATDLTSTTPNGWTARTGSGTVRAIDAGSAITVLPDEVGDNTQTVNASDGWITVNVRLEAWDGRGVVRIGSDGANGTSVDTMPTNIAGDLIVAFSTRANNTAPSLPSGYTDLSSGGTGSISGRVCYKISAGDESSPSFTNGTNTVVIVYRSAKGAFDTVDLGAAQNATSTQINWTGSTVSPIADQSTKFVRFSTFAGTGYTAIPAGWNAVSSWGTPSPSISAYDADGTTDVDSIGANVVDLGFSGVWRAITIRIGANMARYENIEATNAAIPTGAAGCYVTLTGGGGGGGGAATRTGATPGRGGGGGGGGGSIKRVWVPSSSFGSTYSITIGTGGAGAASSAAHGTAGNASVFTSGSTTITANGGGGGQHGDNNVGIGGTGGTTSIGLLRAADTQTGATGGTGAVASSTPATAAGNGVNSAGSGGGGGGGNIAGANPAASAGGTSTDTGSGAGGAAGGTNGTGGTGSAGTSAWNAGGGGGGGGGGNGFNQNGRNGGAAGTVGSGGGGGGGKEGSTGGGGTGGDGANGYVLIEWVYSSSNFFRMFM